MKILLLEDEFMLMRSIKIYLETLGHTVFEYEDGQSAVDSMANIAYDAYILDVDVPVLNGLEVLRHIKQATPNAIVIMITAYTDIDTLVKAYEGGCSEYLKKPFNLKELEIRLMRASENSHIVRSFEPSIIPIGAELRYNTVKQTLYKGVLPIPLTRRENSLIQCLLNHRDGMVTTEMIKQEVFNDLTVADSTVRSLINRLEGKAGDIVRNAKGIGYSLAIDRGDNES